MAGALAFRGSRSPRQSAMRSRPTLTTLTTLVVVVAISCRAAWADSSSEAAPGDVDAYNEENDATNIPEVNEEAWSHIEFFYDPAELRARTDFIDEDGSRRSWFQGALAPWDTKEKASYEGVLGGFGHLSEFDIRDTRELLEAWMWKQLDEKADGKRKLVAIDVAAGVGRVSAELLLDMFDEVDVLEPALALINQASENLESDETRWPTGHRAVNFYHMGWQDFTPEPERYDLILLQWSLLYGHDDDAVEFLHRAVYGLKNDGFIFVKENVAAEATTVDKRDRTITRTRAHNELLFKEAGLKVLEHRVQEDFDPELYEVHMWILWPENDEDAPELEESHFGEGGAEVHEEL